MVSADMCEHDWPGSGCKECEAERAKRKEAIALQQRDALRDAERRATPLRSPDQGHHPMTDIEGLRARTREAINALAAALAALKDGEPEGPRRDGLIAGVEHALNNAKPLDAYTTRLREEMEKVADVVEPHWRGAGVCLSAEWLIGEWLGKCRQIEAADDRAEAAESALAVVTRERDEALGREADAVKREAHMQSLALVQPVGSASPATWKARAEAAEAALAKRDEEVAKLREALERIRNLDEADGHDLTWQHASEAVGLAHQALAKEPTNAG